MKQRHKRKTVKKFAADASAKSEKEGKWEIESLSVNKYGGQLERVDRDFSSDLCSFSTPFHLYL